jgi:hypothetical protein
LRLLKQSSTAQPLVFLMIDSSDHITGKTGLTPTVTLSKSGAAFASPAGSVTEIANGWYKVAGNATDTGTLGPLILHATGTGADPVDIEFEVVAFDPQVGTNLGLSAIPTGNPGAAGGVATAAGVTYFVSTTGNDSNNGRSLAAAFLTVKQAASVAVFGDTVIIGAGTFAEGNNVCTFAYGVKVLGAGRDVTIITSTAALSTKGCILSASYVADLTVTYAGSSAIQAAPFGWYDLAGVTQPTLPHCEVYRCAVNGVSDGFYFRSAHNTNVRSKVELYDCVASSAWDGVVTIGQNAAFASTQWDIEVRLYNCQIAIVGPHTGHAYHAIICDAGLVKMYGGTATTVDNDASSVENYAVDADIYGSVELTDVTASATTSGTGARYDLRQASAGTLKVRDCTYNAARTQGTITILGATLAPTQPNYAPSKAGDAMTLTAGERTTLAALILSSASGSGANVVTVTVVDDDTGDPIGFATVRLGSFVANADQDGVAEFSLDDGNYARSVTDPNSEYEFTPDTITVDAAHTDFELRMSPKNIPIPTDPADCTVVFRAIHAGVALAHTTFSFKCVTAPTGNGTVFVNETRTARSDADGDVEIVLPQSSTWKGRATTGGTFDITVPAASTYELPNVAV